MDIVNLINNLGFPIAVVCYLLWHSNKEEEDHKEEVSTLSTAIENNTIVMQKLVDRLGVNVDVKGD